MNKFIQFSMIFIPALCCAGISHAGLLASATRVVYQQNSNEKSLILANTNSYPVLTQIWVDDGHTGPEFQNSPFAVLPPVFKLSAKENKGIRIIYNGMTLPADRESLYWLNLYEIPAVKKDNPANEYLNLAMNTQMKIFYRPEGLKDYNVDELQQQVQQTLIYNEKALKLELKNPTPYYLNFTNLSISNDQAVSKVSHEEDNILAPFSTKAYTLQNLHYPESPTNILKYQLIDDSGNSHHYSTILK